MQTNSAERAAMSTMHAFNHVNLNTRDASVREREGTMPRAIRQLLPIVRKTYGPVPKMPGWHLRFAQRRLEGREALPGVGMFTISDEQGPEAYPASVGMTCWNTEHSRYCWEVACVMYRHMEAEMRGIGLWCEPDPVPPPGPWLATFITGAIAPDRPLSFKAKMQRLEDVMQFDNLSSDIAWAMVAAEEQGV